MLPDPPSLKFLCMHTYNQMSMYLTPLRKILATGLCNACKLRLQVSAKVQGRLVYRYILGIHIVLTIASSNDIHNSEKLRNRFLSGSAILNG